MRTPARSQASDQVHRKARTLTILAACCLLCQGLSAQTPDDAISLRQIYQSLIPRLDHNPFQRRLYLDSQESPSTVKGEIYAVMDYPFATVNDALNDPSQGPVNWCDVLILHPNIKYCHASADSSGNTLTVNISKKEVAEELGATYRVRFDYHAATTSPGYFQVKLHADSGPLNTRDYQIVLEAVSLSGDRTFLHLTYAYSYGVIGGLAMKGYLATFGRGKVGFTNIADSSAAQAEYVGGVRGLVERNTMRYYLAIDAYLGALSSLPDRRLEQRLSNWFSASEQYPRQLHEIDRQQYMQMKQEEYRRQQTKQ
ncbi:hypothetical protein [Paraburkholderia sp. BL10I2N1]|uniref:hypothetical protein n=1 Tax=Paraburkholderia sp. BL10I2N1 TaxID=1938796 RepID=UPI00105CD89E|nr:hypothetical protein [Paraburkholderia sp. BL10I2N1]TDN70240.1 hypothetical protein B0G77_3701 [Paraburkholderia sp. BL10I2N1]